MCQSQAVRSKSRSRIVFIEKMFDKNYLESFAFSPQPLLRDFCIYLLLNNITFESHQRRKKTKAKQFS